MEENKDETEMKAGKKQSKYGTMFITEETIRQNIKDALHMKPERKRPWKQREEDKEES